MKPYIHDDFLLESDVAKELYHQHAREQPIIDYHCHLSPKDLAENRQFNNLFEIWLEGDHYKWRAMRANGVAEKYCTGEASPEEKFKAFAKTVPATIRNPLHHWTHLELKRYFHMDTLLSETTAAAVWNECNEKLQDSSLSVWGILKQFKVEMIGTTDDPTDDLAYHQQIAQSDCPAKVVPTFRPDKAFAIQNVQAWNAWVDKLAEVSGESCSNLSGLLNALEKRIVFFTEHGCLASDHGIECCPEKVVTESEASLVFDKARKSETCTVEEAKAFMSFVLVWLGERYDEKGWAMQMHLGAARNNNAGLFKQLGPDIGCDSIHDAPQVEGLRNILGEISKNGKLPKTILYNLNPAANYAVATMCGNFFEEGVPGKMQFGTGWWFLDQLEGMTWQINALSSLGLLGNFIGMLTDSRSFMSFPRHEYFRRLLCNLLGGDVRKGLIPNEIETLGKLVMNISYKNVVRYFS